MIDFQSPLTGVAGLPSLNQRSTAGMSSPGGEETGEGELNCRSGRQPALIEVGVCPSGTFENSQQHARVIYGWVHGRQQIRVPRGRQKSFSLLPSLALVHAALSSRIRVNSRNSRKKFRATSTYSDLIRPIPNPLPTPSGVLEFTL